MRIVVTGATGNIGTALLRELAHDDRVTSVLGLARRLPELELPKTVFRRVDVAADDLIPIVEGADAVVHLAWRIQPSHDEPNLWQTNVLGSARVFAAAAEAGVHALVHCSSVGVYSPGPKDMPVEETWPRHGVRSSFYARHKAEAEWRLDAVETAAPSLRVVRIRPGLVFQRDAASGVRRLFAGPLLPTPLLRRAFVPAVPAIPGLRLQAVHAADLARAFTEAVVRDVRGPFNVAAEPVLDATLVAATLRREALPIPARLARLAMATSWRLHLQPSPPGWLDLALGVPLMSSDRARRELGWVPRRNSLDALREMIEGMRDASGAPTPPLDPNAGGPARLGELTSGIGAHE